MRVYACYGQLNVEQRKVVDAFVRGKRVIDLGCGSCALTNILTEICGAAHVIALDYKLPPRKPEPKITFVSELFGDYQGEVPEIAFLSWPVNRAVPSLLPLLAKAEAVIYLGKNTDGTACGWPGLFEHLSRRSLRWHLPAKLNTLTIYGGMTGDRPLTGEEIAALFYSTRDPVSYEMSESLAEADLREMG